MEGVRHGLDPRIEGRIRSAIPPTLICAKIILSQRNSIPESENLAGLPRLPRDEGGPVFAKPWQAAAFALAMRLSPQGHRPIRFDGFLLPESGLGLSPVCSGKLAELVGKPQFNERLSGHTRSPRLTVEGIHHPGREVSVDPLRFSPDAPSLA